MDDRLNRGSANVEGVQAGRWELRPRALRTCPHCQQGVEDVPHVWFACPSYGDSFSAPAPSLCEFMQQDPVLLSAVAAQCQRVHAAAPSERAAAAGGEAA